MTSSSSLQEAFSLYDKANTGFIGHSDVTLALKSAGIALVPDQVKLFLLNFNHIPKIILLDFSLFFLYNRFPWQNEK